jgi:hypothetical protein
MNGSRSLINQSKQSSQDGTTELEDMGMRKFAAWSVRAVDFAAQLAKYQSPRLRAVAIAPPPSVEEKPRRFTLKVFTGGRALEPPIEPVPEPPRDPRYPKPL